MTWYSRLKQTARRNPLLKAAYGRVAKRVMTTRYNARDVYDSYLSRRLAPRTTPFGFQFVGLQSQHHRAMQTGHFEPTEVSLIQSLLSHSQRFVDVGANVGYFTCLARSCGRPVVAFEPLLKNLRCLYENLRANNWMDTEVLPIGLSEKPGLAELFGASSTGASLIDNWAGAPSAFKRTISLSTLDIVLGERFLGERLLIKIDVEGHEAAVIRGAKKILRREVKPLWLLEITLNDFHPDGPNADFAPTFELFFDAGYLAFAVGPTLKPVSRSDVYAWVAAERTPAGHLNYLFIPENADSILRHLESGALG